MRNVILITAVATAVVACDSGCPAIGAAPILKVDAAHAEAGSVVTVRVTKEPQCQVDNGDRTVNLQGVVVSAGGSLGPDKVTVGADGKGTAEWTLGPAPIVQRLVDHDVEIKATVATPAAPSKFADIDKWMTDNKLDGSTEDLAVYTDGTMTLGIPGGLLEVKPDGTISKPALTGDTIGRALGIAHDRDGALWVADSDGKALRKVDKTGKVSTAITGDGTADFVAPNYVAVNPNSGHVVVSDPCLGKLVAYDPAAAKVADLHAFKSKTEGAPNGFAYSADGKTLWVVTENIALLCPAGDKPDIQAKVGALFAIDTSGAGFGARTLVQAGIGHFGDGMALDSEGNLYVVVTSGTADLKLESSQVMVLRKGEKQLVPFIKATDRIIANVAFGRTANDSTTIYAAMLAIPPFSLPETRGVMKFEVGVTGQPLLP